MNDIEEEMIEIVLITFEVIYKMLNGNDLFICLMWFIKIKYIIGEDLGSDMEFERDVKVL